MAVLELKKLLNKCNDNDLVKIKVKKYSVSQEITIDETYEDVEMVQYDIFLENQDDNRFVLCTSLYED